MVDKRIMSARKKKRKKGEEESSSGKVELSLLLMRELYRI
jgi:hypothetical protein